MLVAIRPLCEALGVSTQAQLSKLKTKAWAVTVMITATGADGKPARWRASKSKAWATVTMIVTVAEDGKTREAEEDLHVWECAYYIGDVGQRRDP